MTRESTSSADVLFEIRSEELPATNLADFFESPDRPENPIKSCLDRLLQEKRLACVSTQVWATPRRLVFFIQGIADKQTPKEDHIRLLVKAEAYGPDGKPSEKLLMILKHRNASVEDLISGQMSGKEYVFFKKIEPARKTASVLPELCEELVRALPFPKTMRWDDSGLYFPRPIRGYLCLYGSKSLAVKIGRLKSNSHTSFFAKGKRKDEPVKDISSYFALLKKRAVLLDPKERKKTISDLLEKMARSMNGTLYEDPFLLNEVNFLVENPQGLAAPFDPAFLKLPLEVLAVSMARKQRIFGLLDKQGNVQPRFLAILDGAIDDRKRKIVSSNYEHILHAKLQDSLFFYKEDLKIPLAKKREELKNLVFLKNAGSMLQKSDRLVSLVEWVSAELSLPQPETEGLARACYLAKSDLLTQMVGEFPELQGIVGKYYALENGESEIAAKAISEQYLPRTAQDHLPETTIGALLSVLDRTDLITACFGLGLEPSSSADPYGLRRSAIGILKILVERKINLPLFELIRRDLEKLSPFFGEKGANAFERLRAFFKDRFKALAVEKGIPEDFAEAAIGANFDRPSETFERAQRLVKLSEDSAFWQAWKVVERTHNIIKGNKTPLPSEADPALFSEDLERQVFEAYVQNRDAINQAVAEADFDRATRLYAAAFFDILGAFFDKVFINSEDVNVRSNRHALLGSIHELYTKRVGDLSKVRPRN